MTLRPEGFRAAAPRGSPFLAPVTWAFPGASPQPAAGKPVRPRLQGDSPSLGVAGKRGLPHVACLHPGVGSVLGGCWLELQP